jgi:hypothetical protein
MVVLDRGRTSAISTYDSMILPPAQYHTPSVKLSYSYIAGYGFLSYSYRAVLLVKTSTYFVFLSPRGPNLILSSPGASKFRVLSVDAAGRGLPQSVALITIHIQIRVDN